VDVVGHQTSLVRAWTGSSLPDTGWLPVAQPPEELHHHHRSTDEAEEKQESSKRGAELVELAKQLKAEHDRGTQLGLRDDKLALYDAVCQNDSAVMELGDDVLKRIAQELADLVRANATVDWDKKEQVRASLRRHIRRLLTKYHYPPRQARGRGPARDATGRNSSLGGRVMAHSESPTSFHSFTAEERIGRFADSGQVSIRPSVDGRQVSVSTELLST
jgi:hypothetical protein